MKAIRNNTGPSTTLLAPTDAAPAHVARQLTIEYPRIDQQPEFIDAAAKLRDFGARKAELQERLAQLQAEHAERIASQRSNDRNANDLAAAEALISGARPDNSTEQMRTLEANIATLARAEFVQRQTLKLVGDDLSRAAGAHFAEQHRAAVARLRDAIEALHLANRAESAIRDDLVQLGYTGPSVPYMGYAAAHDANDHTGSPAFYWLRETADYLQTPAQKQATARKGRLASLIG